MMKLIMTYRNDTTELLREMKENMLKQTNSNEIDEKNELQKQV